ncbi:MAG: hypothetical protein ACLQQ4_13410 [Bacteroidia bacterium]
MKNNNVFTINGTHFLGTVCQSVPFFRKTAKKISRKLENGIPQILRDQSVPFFRKNAKEFIKTIEKMHPADIAGHKCAFFKNSGGFPPPLWAGLLGYLGEATLRNHRQVPPQTATFRFGVNPDDKCRDLQPR